MTNFTGCLVKNHFITLNYLTTNSFFMHMPQLQKQHSLPQTRQLTSAMLNGNKIAAVQNTLHVPCTLTCTTDQSLLTTQPFTIQNKQHLAYSACSNINFHSYTSCLQITLTHIPLSICSYTHLSMIITHNRSDQLKTVLVCSCVE